MFQTQSFLPRANVHYDSRYEERQQNEETYETDSNLIISQSSLFQIHIIAF